MDLQWQYRYKQTIKKTCTDLLSLKKDCMMTKLAHITEFLWDVFFCFPYPHVLCFILLDISHKSSQLPDELH